MHIDFEKIISLAHTAGKSVLDVYHRDFEIYSKADKSPLTEADLASHNEIIKGLAILTPNIPILSEESKISSWAIRKNWNRYWLVDPLDGTKEFLKRNNEFTINIALIEENKPIWGVVYAPVLDWTYVGDVKSKLATKIIKSEVQKIKVANLPNLKEQWRIVGSRSHKSKSFENFFRSFSCADLISMGSSLKLCLVAEGAAHLYPRFGLTSEWDTAAADAVLRAAGGECLQMPSLEPLIYNKMENILNPYFICCKHASNIWSDSILKIDVHN